MSRARVAILGANGQVGTELGLLLAGSTEIDVRGVVRSPYGAALFRLAQIPYAVADFDDAEALGRALGDCDLVVDLTYPGGQLVDIPHTIERNLKAIMKAMRPGARYLHMSSIMAFGTPSDATTIRDYRVPRVSYGHIKREAENKALKLGRVHGIETLVCRLGQVHGVLQGVTQEYLRGAIAGELRLVGAPGALSTTIFTNEVADAVRVCARGGLNPERIYTLVSNPQWTLAELGEAYRSLHAPQARLTYEAPSHPRPTTLIRGLIPIGPARDFVEAYVFPRVPSLFIRAKGGYRVRSVRGGATSVVHGKAPSAIPCLVGAIPGTLVPGLDSSLAETVKAQRALTQRYEAILESARR